MHKAHGYLLAHLLTLSTLLTSAAWADTPEAPVPTFEGGLTGIYQNTDEDRVDDEATASIDLFFTTIIGPGELFVFAEGNTSLKNNGLANRIPEANADAGTALDNNGDGRLQISELRYALPVGENTQLIGGLLDPTAFLDASGPATSLISFTGVANEETTQFMGASFVNNPTIEFPDYTLGLELDHNPENGAPGVHLLIAGSNGLADNADRSYSDLFDVGDNGKGVFAAAELYWHPKNKMFIRAGAWTNTRDHAELSANSQSAKNFGFYGLLDGALGDGAFNIRVGWADPDVSPAETFVALAAEHPLVPANIGLGIARIGASDRLGSGTDNSIQAEAYARFAINQYLHISPDIQYIKNSGFNDTGTGIDQDIWVFGLRIGALFSTL